MDHIDVVAPYIWDVLASNDILGIPDFIEKATDPYWHFSSRVSRTLASLLPDKIGNEIGPKLLPIAWRAHRQDELFAKLFTRLAALD